jgi:hypothetical protein
LADKIRIRELEKTIQNMKTAEDLNWSLAKAVEEVGKLNAYDRKQQFGLKLVKEVYTLEVDPKLIRVLGCIKKYASEIKEHYAQLGIQMIVLVHYLEENPLPMNVKEELEVQKPHLEQRSIPGLSWTGTKDLESRKCAGHTPAGSTLSASTPKGDGQLTPKALLLTKDCPINITFGKVSTVQDSKEAKEEEAEEKMEEEPAKISGGKGLEDK